MEICAGQKEPKPAGKNSGSTKGPKQPKPKQGSG